MNLEIKKIVLTGGPCSGKTTLIAKAKDFFDNMGWFTLIVPEQATIVIGAGIPMGKLDLLANVAFQKTILNNQIIMEDSIYGLAEQLSRVLNKKILLIHDRGVMDGKAYISKDDWYAVLQKERLNEISLKERYDGVIHLVTAANGAEKFYTLENNVARYETPEQARAVDERTKDAWTGNSHFKIIDNSTGFNEKMNRALSNICDILGEPLPLEKERKFLVASIPKFDIPHEVFDIEQTYLISLDSRVERRVRKKTAYNNSVYFYTEKTETGNNGERIEIERTISFEEYLKLRDEFDIELKTIVKKRYCFVYKNKHFELDVFQDIEEIYLEIELRDMLEEVDIPSFINVKEEVTGNKYHSNYSIALRLAIIY